MRKPPVLDNRTKQDIMAELRRRAASYVPEWKYDPSEMDAGGALAELFGDMFYGTVDRLGMLPNKYYTEFLNLLGAGRRDAQPATGCLRFACTAGAEAPAEVPEGTAAFAATEAGNIVCETAFRIEAVPAALQNVFYADPAEDMVSEWPLDGAITFFAPSAEGSVQRHECAFACGNALLLTEPCTVEVQIAQTTHFLENDTASFLGDRERFAFEYFNGETYVPFDGTEVRDNIIRLTKAGNSPILADEQGMALRLRAVAPPEGDVVLAGIRVRSELLSPCRPQSLAYVDVPIGLPEGGYCFGRRPAEYDMFFLRSDDVFSKRGADVHLSLNMATVTWSDVDTSAQYIYGSSIIDKRSAKPLELEDIFVEQVVWEYWNGLGWAKLDVRECRNPFNCKEDGKRDLVFTCPADMAPATVNAEEGWYIRARVVNVENYFSTRGRWLLPFVKDALCSYRYRDHRPVHGVRALNNGRISAIENCESVGDLRLTAIARMEDAPRAMYLCFDGPVNALPLSLYLDVAAGTGLGARLRAEYLAENGFRTAQLTDHTEDLRGPGTILLYLPEPTAERELFGVRGHWLRLLSDGKKNSGLPVVNAIHTNAAAAVQRRRAEDQYFNTDVYDANKELRLLDAPVMECEVWIDEAGSIAASELQAMEAAAPGDIRTEWDGTEMTHCFVRWREAESLRFAGNHARVFELDAQRGILTFGDGKHGSVPPEGNLNIRVSYATCAGSAGNLPVGAVDTLVTPIAGITGVTNITAMCGGADQQSMEELSELGSGIARRRGRALSARDFEELVRERFGSLRHVRCFANTDEKGGRKTGAVCLVITPGEGADRRYTRKLCQEIKDYLLTRCDSMLAANGGLSVVPSVAMTVNVTAVIRPEDWDTAANTQRLAASAIDRLIEDRWEGEGIGKSIRPAEVYRAVKSVPGVALIEELLIEGEYEHEGKMRIAPLNEGLTLPFVSVQNGVHIIKLR